MLDDDQGLISAVDLGTMEGMAGHNVDISWEMVFEGSYLWVFARCLSANDGTQLGSWYPVRRIL